MKKTTALQLFAATVSLSAVLFTGCSTVYCGTQQTVPINSKPGGAHVTVFNEFSEPVFKGVTPCQVRLDRKSANDENAQYRVAIEAQGYEPYEVILVGKVTRAYFANIVNFVGFIIDPITGGMWALSPDLIEPELKPIPGEEMDADSDEAHHVTVKSADASKSASAPQTARY